MWAIVINEKIIKTFEEYEDALNEFYDLFMDGVNNAKLRKIEKVD